MDRSQSGQIVRETLSRKTPLPKKKKQTNWGEGCVEWLKVYTLSSNPKTAQKEVVFNL
jgi:hypothetical protein